MNKQIYPSIYFILSFLIISGCSQDHIKREVPSNKNEPPKVIVEAEGRTISYHAETNDNVSIKVKVEGQRGSSDTSSVKLDVFDVSNTERDSKELHVTFYQEGNESRMEKENLMIKRVLRE